MQKEKIKNMNKKRYLTTQELISLDWFPIRSTITVQKLIESGELKAIDISTNPKLRRWRISIDSANDWVEKNTSGSLKKVGRFKKKK